MILKVHYLKLRPIYYYQLIHTVLTSQPEGLKFIDIIACYFAILYAINCGENIFQPAT